MDNEDIKYGIKTSSWMTNDGSDISGKWTISDYEIKDPLNNWMDSKIYTYQTYVSTSELALAKAEIDEKMKKFLTFLELKGIVKKGEYQEFLDSLEVFNKMEKE